MASEAHTSSSKPLPLMRQMSAIGGVSAASLPQSGQMSAAGPPVAPLAPVQAFVLRLPDHQKELHRFIWELFDQQVHTDVTIVLDDGQHIRAHKLILSAFSVYFRQVLSRITNSCQQTIIVVKDMLYEDMRSLVEFMYRGCVTVPERRLQHLLNCAKQLKIRGLFDINEENCDQRLPNKCFKNGSNIGQTDNHSPIVSDNHIKAKEFRCFDRKLSQTTEPIVVDKNANYSHDLVTDWLNKKTFAVPSPPKFLTPLMTPMNQKIALDLTKRMSAHNSEPCLPISSLQSPPVCHPGFPSHPSLFRSTSVDECQLNKNKFAFNGINTKPKRGPSSLDGHLDDNNNFQKEKKRNLNIFHAAKYRNRKKHQLEMLFSEETELQKKNCLAKVEIERLESTILSLIWQHTKKTYQSRTVFSCPVCGNVQTEVPKLRSHINMLHNDTEALMKFLMLQRSPPFASPAITANNSANQSTNSSPSVMPSMPSLPSLLSQPSVQSGPSTPFSHPNPNHKSLDSN